MPDSKLKSGWLRDAVAPKIFSNTSDDTIKNILGNSAGNTGGWNLTSWLSRNPLSLTGQIASTFGDDVARNVETGMGNTVGGLLTTVGELGVGVSKSFQDDWKPDHWRHKAFDVPIYAAENIRDLGLAISDAAQKHSEGVDPSPEYRDRGVFENLFDPNYWKDPRGMRAEVAQGFGSSAIGGLGGKALETAIPKGIATRIGSSLANQGTVGRALGNGLLKFRNTGAGRIASSTLHNGLPYSTAVAPFDAAANAGELYRELHERGYSDQDIATEMAGAMIDELPMDILQGAVEGNILFGKGMGLAGKTWRGRLGYGSLNIPLEMGGEYFQEGNQESTIRKHLGKSYTPTSDYLSNLFTTGTPFAEPEERSAATAGAIGSILQSSGGTISNAVGGDEKFDGQLGELRDKAKDISSGEMPNDTFRKIVNEAQEQGVPVELALALATAESNGNQNVVSHAGAIGVMQLMPDTAKGLGVDPHNEDENIRGGINYLKQMLDRYNGDWQLAAAAYNAGPGNVTDHVPKNGETEHYVERIGEYLSKLTEGKGINILLDDEEESIPADFGEGKYWIRQGDNVSYEGAQPQTMPALYALSKWFYEHTGKPLVVSAVTNGDSHVGGERGHYAGWKFDVHDGGSGAEGALFTDDFQRGELLDEFVKYGQNLGLGMNVESLGTGNVHLDVSAAGDQWEGEFAGHNFGGFKGNKATPAKNKDAAPNISATEQPLKNNEGDSVIDGIIQNLLTSAPETQLAFDMKKDNKLNNEIFKMFVDERKNNSEGEDAAAFINFLQENKMLKDDGTFISNKGNRELLRKEFGEEIQAFGDNLIAERYNRFMESQKSAAEKIKAAFTELVQREVDEGNPDAMKHQKILQNGDIDAMTQLLKDAKIDFDATPSESQTQTQTESEEILNPADGWQKFSPDNQAKLIQNLKSALESEGALDENLATALDNGDTQAISDALNIFRQINRDKPIQQILNADAETLSDDAQKFRENYLKLKDDIAQLEQQRAHYEADMQQKSSEKGVYTGNAYRVYDYYGDKNQIAAIDKKLEKARAELQNLQAPKNFKRVSESEQLENDIRRYDRTLSALNQRMQDIGEPKDGKSARRYNKLVREKNAALENLWKAQSRYDELNDAGKIWRESADIQGNDLLDLVQLGIEQTQRKLDAVQRTSRKASDNPKATQNAMRLGSQLATLKSVFNTKVNPVLTVAQAIEGIADARNTFDTLINQIADIEDKLTAAENQGDTTTAESLKSQLPQLQEQAAKALVNFQTLNEETAKSILQTAPQVLSKVFGQRGHIVNPIADISAENVKSDYMTNIQQQISDILINGNQPSQSQQIQPQQDNPADNIQSPKLESQSDNNPLNQLTDEEFENLRNSVNNARNYFGGMNDIPVEALSEKDQDILRQAGVTYKIFYESAGVDEEWVNIESFDNAVNERLQSAETSTPMQENIQPKLSPIEKATQELNDLTTRLAQATKDKDSEDDTIALNAYKQIEPLKKQINEKNKEIQNLKAEQKKRAEMTPLDKAQEELSELKAQARETVKARQQAEKNKDDKAQLATFRKQEELDKQIAQKKAEIKNLKIEQLQNEISRLQEERKKLIATKRESKKIGDQKTEGKITKQLETLKKNINQKTNQLQQLGGKLKSQPSQPVQTQQQTPPVQENIQPADNVQSPQQNIQPAKSVQTPKTESAVQEKPADNVQSPKTESQPNNNPLNQLTDEEFENIRNAVNNARKYFGGMDEIPVENFSEKEQNLLRQTGMTYKTDNEFSGKEEEVLHLETFDNAVNSRLKSGKTQPPVQQNPAPADNVQSPKTESPKTESTFAQDVLPKENVSPDENRVVEGDKTKIVADNGKEYEVQYKVVEANDLVASHYLNREDSKVDRNENYPAELQPRDRDRISMQSELLSMSNSLRPADLMDSRNLNQGAPIVRNDNVVLNGNGRTAAIQFAYENGKADHYKQAVVNNAEKFGLNRDAIAQMKNPVLVREMKDKLSERDLQAITESQTGGAKFGASEQAKNDAGKIQIRTLELYVDNDNGNINTSDNREFLISVLQDILNKNEFNAYTTADGNINADGIRRAKRALFALAYDDDTLIDKIAESTDDNIKRITNALESAAPQIAQIQAKMKEGVLHSYDLSDIASAAAKLSDIRKDKNLTVQNYLGQQTLAEFGEESEIKKALVKFFDEHKNSAIYISDFLKGIADIIERQGNPNQDYLFNETPKSIPFMKLIDNAKEIAETKLRERSESAKPKQINLFEEPEKTPAERIGEALKNATPAPVQNEDEQEPPLDLQQSPAEVKTSVENVNAEEKIDVTSPEAWRTREEIAADIEGKGLRRRKKQPAPVQNKEEPVLPLDLQQSPVKNVNVEDKKESTIDDEIMDISHVAPNIDISEEDRLWAELDKEFKKLSANPIFNPKIYTIGLKLGMLYIKKGMSKFSDWAKELTNKGGENIKPWLSSIWETIRSYPPKTNFDEELISTFSEYIGSLIANKQVQTYEDVLARFKEDFEKEDVEKFAPAIEAAYKGIKKFFDENSNNQQDAENKKAPVIVTGDEFGEYANIEELRDKAIKYYKDNLQGTSVENKSLGKIEIDSRGLIDFTTSGRKKLQSTSRENRKLLLIKHLYELLKTAKNARNVESIKEKHNHESFIYMDNQVKIGEDTLLVHITLVKRNNGDIQFFNYNFIENEKRAGKSARPESSNEALGTLPVSTFSKDNISQNKTEDKAILQENTPTESQAQNVYTELQHNAQRGENLTKEEKTVLVSNPENLVVDEDLREALYKKLPNVKHCIDIAFRAVKQFGTTDAKETLAQFLVSDRDDEYSYAAQQLINLWRFERRFKNTDQNKLKSGENEIAILDDLEWEDKISAKELYGRTLKALYNLNEKSHRKPTSDYALNLENFKLYGKKSETRTTGDSKIIAKMSSDYKGIAVTQTTNGMKLTYQIPLSEVDKVADDNDAFKNLVDKYLSNAYKKLAAENNIPAEQIQESIEGVLDRFADYHNLVVSNMHGHFREEVPVDENATPAENPQEEKASPAKDITPKNDDQPKPLLLPDGSKPYDVYKQTLDKKWQEFLEETLGVFEIQRHNLVEDAVRDKKPRESLKTEGERKYYDWLKAQLGESGYTIEERHSKGDNGRDEYTAVAKGDFKTDAGKKLLNNLKELAEKLGGELKQSSDKVASFYFGEKTKPLKQFQTAAKYFFNQKESDASKNDEVKAENLNNPKSQNKVTVKETRQKKIKQWNDYEQSPFIKRIKTKGFNAEIKVANRIGLIEVTAFLTKKSPVVKFTLNIEDVKKSDDKEKILREAVYKGLMSNKSIAIAMFSPSEMDLAKKIIENYNEIIKAANEVHEDLKKRVDIESPNQKHTYTDIRIKSHEFPEDIELIKRAGLENEPYSSGEFGLDMNATVDIISEYGEIYDGQGVMTIRKKFSSEQEQHDLQNIIKLAEVCGGEYIGNSSFSFEDSIHKYIFYGALIHFSRNDHLKEKNLNWINEHKFKYDENKSVEENMAVAEKIAQEYLDIFGITANINTPERIELRRQIIEELYGNGAQKKERKAFLIMGLPASGKSTIADSVAKENGALIIDSDMAKEKLPEFNGGLLANAVHDESTSIANRILDSALLSGDNVVLPIVGSYESDVQEKIQRLNSEGYEVNLYHVALTLEKTLERTQNRFKETGRLVSTTYIKSVGTKPKENYDKLKNQEEVNSYAEWSNDVDRGQRPRLLERSERTQDAESGLGLGRTQLSQGLDERNGTPSESQSANQGERRKGKVVGTSILDVFTKANGDIEEGIKILFDAPNDTYVNCEYSSGEVRVFVIKYKDNRKEIVELPEPSHPNGILPATMHNFQLLMGDAVKINITMPMSKAEVTAIREKERETFIKREAELKQYKISPVSEIKPFDEEQPIPVAKQTEPYKKAYSELKNLWEIYKKGNLTEEEMILKVRSILKAYHQSTYKGMKPDQWVVGKTILELRAFEKEQDSLREISDKMVRKNDQIKAQRKLMTLLGHFIEDCKSGVIPAQLQPIIAKKVDKIIRQVKESKITPITGAEKLENYLAGAVIDEAFNNGGLLNMDAINSAVANNDPILKKAQEIYELNHYGNTKGEVKNESRKLGQSESADDGHKRVQSDVRAGTDESARQERRNTSPERNIGQQRQDKGATAENNIGTNAESERPVAETSAGKSSENDSEGNGVRGNTGAVHAAGRDDRRRNAESLETTSPKSVKENSPTEIAGHNYHITNDSGIGEGGLKTKFKQNIDAIKLLKQLESEGRLATPNEQAILAQFNGWGTVAAVFSDDSKWEKERQQLKEILTEEEYKSASAATPNAFYTSPEISQAIWQGLNLLGFKGGRVLDPSMGSGIFFGTMPLEIASKSELTGVELDDLTGRIAKQLYQNAAIDIIGFQDKKLPNNYYDLAISNVPFGTIRYKHGKQTYNIHNFFFAKAMDAVRPGGLVAFITGTGTMQAGQDAAILRAILNGQADLIAAFKLPSQTFEKNAGTSVTSDILILQKRLDTKTPSEHAQSWSNIESINVTSKKGYSLPMSINEYFNKNPQNMIGKPVIDDLIAGFRLGLDGKGLNVAEELSARMNKLPENIYKPVEGRKNNTIKNIIKYDGEKVPTYSFITQDGKIYQQKSYEVVEVPKENQPRVKDYLRLVKAVENILNEQNSNPKDDKLPQLRQTLTDAYDNFVKNNGYINSAENIKILGSDPRFGMTAAIENYHEDKKAKTVTSKKGDIFYKRTLGAMVEPSTAENINDALSISIAWRGELDIDYMSKLLGKTPAQVIDELGDNVFENPLTHLYELAEEYLSGNVREKLAIAEEAAKTNPKYKRNVEALRDTKVQPTDLNEDQITVNIGAFWVDVSYYNQFLAHMLGVNSGYVISLNKKIGKWTLTYNHRQHYNQATGAKNTITWGVEGTITFTDIMERLLNSKSLEITYTEEYIEDGKKKKRTRIDEEKTAAVKQKAQEIQQEFEKNWLWKDADRKADLLKTYNTIFNSVTERKYDGSRLTFPTLNPSIELYPHQKDAVWRIMQGQNVLLAHCVGAGKTYTMIASAIEMKRLGKIRKPLFAVPNNIVKQFEEEFLTIYPKAKILVIQASDLPAAKITDVFDDSIKTRKSSAKNDDDDENISDDDEVLEGEVAKNESTEVREKRLAKRRAVLSRIATEDWDGIIISHEMLKRLPMSPETYNKFYREQLAELQASYEVLVASGEKDASVKEIQTAIANLQEKLKRDTSKDSDEIAIPFEELGIDQIYVDESDKFKNLRINTAMKRISGLQVNGSQRATEMYVKTKWLTEHRNGGGVVFASGTPISNTLGEIYTVLRFLGGNMLKEKEMEYFDLWAGTFTEKSTGTELNPNGNGFRQTTFLTMTNLIANSKMLRQFADIQYAEDLPHLKRPKLKNGGRTIIEVEPTPEFNEFKLELLRRAEEVKKSKRKKGADNMLTITGDFRAGSIDLQLVKPEIEEAAAGNKIPVLCDVITKKYNETADVKGTQLVFCDLGTPSGKRKKGGNKSVYHKIKERLVQNGIPANQIAFVHDARTADERQALFKRVNEGEIRVIIGSTEKMGAGTNFQKHLVALHHVDCCWKPRDIEQREGRILRKGNLNDEVEIFTYVVKDSYDGNMWEKVTNKQRMIDSVLRGDPLVNKVVDSEESMSFGELQAAALGNPLMKERTAVANKLAGLEISFRAHRNQQLQGEMLREDLSKKIPTLKRQIEIEKADIKARTDTKGDAFQIKIGDKIYTNRADADKALQEVIKNFKEPSVTKIGKIGGFDINFRLVNLYKETSGAMEVIQSQVAITLMNRGTYRVKANSISGIENTLRNAPDNSLKSDTAELEKSQAKLSELEKQLDKPFAQQEEMEKTRRRLEEIDAEINNGTNQEQQTVSNELENKNTPLQNLQTYEDATITNAEKSSEAQNTNFLMPIKSRYDWQNTNIHYRDFYTDVDSEINTPDGKIKVHFRFSESGSVAQVDMSGIKSSDSSFSSTRDSAAERRGGTRAGEQFGYSPYEPVYYFGKAENAVEYIEKMLDEYYSETAVNENPREIDFENTAHKVIDGKGLPQIIIAYSQTGDGSTAINNLVDSKNLTDQHKLLQQLGNAMGANVVFFNNYNRDFHGAYEGGTIYLNVNSARSLTTTFAHELFHFLKANNPKLFSEMAKAAGITETQLANYLAETKRTDVTKTADVTEEMIADAMQQILSRVAKKDKSLVQRFLAWLKDTFQKFKDLFQNPKGKLTRGQYAKLADTFGKMAVKLTDAYGNKLFRYNTRTHNLELANGESLETLLDDNENESSDEQGFFNLDGLSLAGAKFSRNNEDDTTENISEDEPSLNQTQINELFNGVNVSDEFSKLQTTTPINVSNELSQSTSRRNLIQAAKNAFSERYPNGVTVNTQIGEVKITRSSINDSLRHLLSRAKADSVLSLPTGIRNAAYIGKLEDFDGNPIINHYFVYPINYEGQKHLVLCRVREIGSAKNFYVHAIVSYDEINERSSTLRPSVVNNEQTQTLRRTALYKAILTEFFRKGNRENAGTTQNATLGDGIRYSIGSSSNSQTSTNTENDGTIQKWFNDITQKISRALHIDGDRIVTAETAVKRLRAEREKAMDDYIKNPTKENRQRLKDLKISRLLLDAYKNGEEYVNDLNFSDMYRRSPSRIAEKVSAFRAYFRMGDKAMDKLVRLRDKFAVGLNAAMDFLKNKDDNDALTTLLIDGDANEMEYGVLTEQEKDSIKASTSPENVTKKLHQARIQKICAETGVSENVAKAYVKVRQLMTQSYHMLNEAKRRPQIKSAHLSDTEINALKNNKFVTITRISDNTDEDGNRLVTYKRYAHTDKKYTVTESVLNKFKKDPAMQVVKATVKGIENGEKIFYVEVREGIAELTNKAGYVPHLFHEYMIRVKDKDGKIVERFGYGGVIGSGRTQVEAVKIAEEWQKKNPNALKDGEEIYIAPKIANFKELGMDEKNYAPIMGDKDFDSMVHNIAKYADMKIKDAKDLVDGSVKLKNRHRFFGNFMQRKGAKGYSQDMQWVLRHYLNSVARYVALETEFKPQAISLFERHFGAFGSDWENNSLAKYTKQYINDINGNPSTLETILNKMLNQSEIWRNFFVPKFGERAALSLTNDITRRVSYLKLGMLNISSALLNLSQLINAAGYLGGGGRLLKHLNSVVKRKGKLTYSELRILTESGVLSDIGIDTSGGYDKNRGYSGSSMPIIGKALTMIDIAGDKSMYLFRTMDKLCRISTTLAAYEQAIESGKTRNEALGFAKKVNRDANFSYGVEDAPNIFRRSSVIGKIALQFKNYPVKMLEIIGDMLPASKKTTTKQKIAFWFPYLLMCGLMGLPFLDWFDDLFGEKFGLFPKDFLQKTAIQGSQEIFGDNEVGKLAGNIAMYGAPAAFDIDMSKRAGLAAIMPQNLSDFLLGATGSTITGFVGNMFDGTVNGTEGAYLNALRSVSPGLYNIYAAFEGETLGARGRKTSVYNTFYERLIRGAGFKSVDESLATDIQRITYNERDKINKEKQRAVDAFIKNPTTENAQRLKELGVRPDTVKKERERKQADRLGRVQAGMTKSERERNQYLFNFAR